MKIDAAEYILDKLENKGLSALYMDTDGIILECEELPGQMCFDDFLLDDSE